jgi:hypothetical protein
MDLGASPLALPSCRGLSLTPSSAHLKVTCITLGTQCNAAKAVTLCATFALPHQVTKSALWMPVWVIFYQQVPQVRMTAQGRGKIDEGSQTGMWLQESPLFHVL